MKAKILRTLVIFISIGLFWFPGSVSAAVEITEVMYDVSGADTGREWIEVTNTGADAVDLSGYKFFEAETNHGLTVTEGESTLSPGSSAIIADNPVAFKTDWPQFSGLLFDSSFSLSNTGEVLAIKNSALEVEDSVSYAVDMGGAGDGNSLHREGGSFIVGAPNPGSTSAPPPPLESSQGDGDTTSDDDASGSDNANSEGQSPQSPSSESSKTSSSISARIIGKNIAIAGAHASFEGEALSGGVLLTDAKYLWNFGDGATSKEKKVLHTYAHPGKYVIVLSVSSDDLNATQRLMVEIVSLELSLVAQQDGTLNIVNRSKRETDIGLWGLSGGGVTFAIPEGTVILPGETVHFAQGITGIRGDLQARLLYPGGTMATTAQSGTAPSGGMASGNSKTTSTKTAGSSRSSAGSYEIDDSPSIFTTETAAAAVATATDLSFPLWSYILALMALVTLGVVGVLYARAAQLPEETKSPIDEFEILDAKE